jgi:hypothetical protein
MKNVFCFRKIHNKNKYPPFQAGSKILMTNDKHSKMLSRIHIILPMMAILLHFSVAGQTIQRTINWDKAEKTYTNSKGVKVKTLSFEGSLAN